MNGQIFLRHIRSTPALQEWEDLGHERFLLLLGIMIASGGLLLLVDQQLVSIFQPNRLFGKPAPVLALLLVAIAALSYSVARQVNAASGLLTLVVGLSGGVWLALYASASPAIGVFVLVPAILAILVFTPVQSFVLCVALAVLPLWIEWPAPYPASELHGALLCLIAAVWMLYWIVRSRQVDVLKSYDEYMQNARRHLEDARNDRLSVNQLNADLAEAYGQLSRLYKLLQASRLEAEVARRTKEQFVANVSHELRTPLNMIIGFSEMITETPEAYGENLPRALLSDIHVIHRNSQHLSELINDVLVLSQAEAGQMSLSRTWCPIYELVNEAVQAVEPLFKSKKLALTAEIAPDLAPIFCDRLRIRQVLLNLLSNAGRYTQQGGVVITTYHAERYIVFAVRDTGPGIPTEDQLRIFEPFQQAGETTKRNNGGSGLGLSISRQLIELHQGRMWLESEMGAGATFFFTLPYNIHDDDTFQITRWLNPYAPYEQSQRRSLPPVPVAKERILVLESTQVLRPQLGALLTDLDVIAAEHLYDHTQNVQLQHIETETTQIPPAVVVVNDAGAMNEKNFSRRLLNLPERTPIISCYLPAQAEALEHLNVVDYLIKPVTRVNLLVALEKTIAPGAIVLIVEDQAETARLVRRQLTSAGHGYRILHAADSEAALQLMRTRRPDLVLLDLGLADRDGYELLQEKNRDPAIKSIPVVILSARDPLGGPIVTGRLRLELVGGLSVHDIAQCISAIRQAFSPAKRAKAEASPEIGAG